MTMMVLAARAGFAIAFGTCLATLWMMCHVVHALGPLVGLKTERQRREVSIQCAQLCFRYLMLAPCWWIKLVGVEEFEQAFLQAKAESGTPYMICNHNSMVDSLVGTALMPSPVSKNMRSLIKLALFSEPLFGYVCEAVGHFPVFFTGAKSGDFTVDKEAQARVTGELDLFIGSGGGLCIFPEGQLNSNPRTLQQFRRGAFALPIKYGRPIHAFINVGCEQMWPKGQPIGGIPAEIHVKFFKICDDASKFDPTELATHAQRVMQAEMDVMYARKDAACAKKEA